MKLGAHSALVKKLNKKQRNKLPAEEARNYTEKYEKSPKVSFSSKVIHQSIFRVPILKAFSVYHFITKFIVVF